MELERYIALQEQHYYTALQEIDNGKKVTHWIWYIFPQLSFGQSSMAKFFAIKDIEEAREYLNHPVLGERLVEISNTLLNHKDKPILDIFGTPDDLKVKSCMTLFALVSKSEKNIFTRVLQEFYNGEHCELTINKLK